MKRFFAVISVLFLVTAAGCASAPAEHRSSKPPACAAPFAGTLTLSAEGDTMAADVQYDAESGLTFTVTAPAALQGVTLQYHNQKGTMSLPGTAGTNVSDDSVIVSVGKLFAQSAAPVQNGENWVYTTSEGSLTLDGTGKPVSFRLTEKGWQGTFTNCTLSEYTGISGGKAKR